MLCITAVQKDQVTGLAVYISGLAGQEKKNHLAGKTAPTVYAYQQCIYIFFRVWL